MATAARRGLTFLRSRSIAPHQQHRLAVPLLNRIKSIQQPSGNQTRFKPISGYSSLNDPTPKRRGPPKNTTMPDGCDYKHWFIVMEFPENDKKPSEEEMINSYVKTLAAVVGSEEEAKKKIYSVCTAQYTGFGALISEELSRKVKELPGVEWVLPDSYLDVPKKDYGGDLFVEGKVIHRPPFPILERQRIRSRPQPRNKGGQFAVEDERTSTQNSKN